MTHGKPRLTVCEACGISPVNHSKQYISSGADSLTSSALYFTYQVKPLQKILSLNESLKRLCVRTVFAVAIWLGVIKLDSNIPTLDSTRTKVVIDEAKKLGISVEQMIFDGRRTDRFRALVQGKHIYFESLPIPDGRGSLAYLWMDDKYLLKKFFVRHSIPVPFVQSHTSLQDIKNFFDNPTVPRTVIVKPRFGSLDRHTTTRISTQNELERAFVSAQLICPQVCIEEHLEGGVSRATCIDGKLEGFFTADAPYVMGDGIRSIEELIREINISKPDRLGDVIVSSEIIGYLSRTNFTINSVPKAGQRVQLSHYAGRQFGGYTREILPTVHPDLRAQIERAACVLGVSVVGFDLIIPDPEQDPAQQKWGIIEANSLPFIDLHYYALVGHSNPAKALWELWLR
ncbi:MAG: cyanophycin synthetase [Candidatus Kaiserbacteria bacterium]|nr:cyanophycin synthetase [Candidatus Kaiserbacteria bacterium]